MELGIKDTVRQAGAQARSASCREKGAVPTSPLPFHPPFSSNLMFFNLALVTSTRLLVSLL